MARERQREDVQNAQLAFRNQQPNLDASKLIFIDESGFRLGGTPRYGWAPRGQDAPGTHVQANWDNITMIGAMALDGFRGFMTVDSGTGNEVFQAFVEQQLIPNLRAGDTVVMDNLSAHKNLKTQELIREAGANILYTPPYSPEFNPIEKAWAKLKDIIRRFDTLTRELFDEAVVTALTAISENDRIAWTKHAGYSIN